jgi:hypothetical protein
MRRPPTSQGWWPFYFENELPKEMTMEPKTLEQICEEQAETIAKQFELLKEQKESIDALVKVALYSAETTQLLSHKIAELRSDVMLANLQPVNDRIM